MVKDGFANTVRDVASIVSIILVSDVDSVSMYVLPKSGKLIAPKHSPLGHTLQSIGWRLVSTRAGLATLCTGCWSSQVMWEAFFGNAPARHFRVFVHASGQNPLLNFKNFEVR